MLLDKKFAACLCLLSLGLSPIEALAEQKKSTAATTADSQWVNQVFQKGKAYYEAGDYQSAITEWNRLDPYLSKYPSLRRVITYLKSQILAGPGTALKSSTEAGPGRPIQEQKTALPTYKEPNYQASSEAVKTFGEAAENMQEALRTAVRERSKQAQSPGERSDWVAETLKKGKRAADKGDWETAFHEWSKVEPYLEPSSPETERYKRLKKNYEMYQVAMRQNEAVAEQRKSALTLPPEFGSTMQEAGQKIEKHILDLQNKRVEGEKDAVFQQAWVNTTFERGQKAFLAGNYTLAVEEWDKLSYKIEDRPDVLAQIKELKASLRALREAEMKLVKSPEIDSTATVNTAQMQGFFKNATVEMKSRANEVIRQNSEKQQTAASIQKNVDDTFERGKILYQKGRQQDALNEWMLLSSHFETDPSLKSAFLSLKGSIEAYRRSLSGGAASPDGNSYKIKLPDDFYRFIEQAGRDLSEKARLAEADKEKTEQAVSSKRLELSKAFERGKNQYASGKVLDAIEEWKKITPWIDNGKSIQTDLQRIEAGYRELQIQTTSLKEAQSKAAGLFMPPAELGQMLSSAEMELKNKTQVALNERVLLQQTQSSQQAAISNIMYKSSLALKAGKMDQAVAEWQRLAPYLPPASEEKALIEEVSENYLKYAEAQKGRREAQIKSEQKIELPLDLRATLSKTNDQMLRDASQARAEQESKALLANERQSTVISSIEKGKQFFQAGRYEEAIGEWEKLYPFLDRASEDRLLIEGFKQNYLDSREASRQLKAVQSKSATPFSMPADLSQLIVNASQALKSQTNGALSEKADLEHAYNQQNSAVLEITQKSILALKSRQPEQAITELQKLPPYLPAGSEGKTLIEDLKDSFAKYAESVRSLKRARSLSQEKVDMPADLMEAIRKMNQTLIEQTAKSEADAEGQNKAYRDKQSILTSALENGKQLFQAGRYEEAIKEWEKLYPYFDRQSPERLLLDGFKQNYQEASDAKKRLDLAIQSQSTKTEIPVDVKQILTDGSLAMLSKAAQSRQERERIEKMFLESQTVFLAAIEKAKVYTQAGRMGEALGEWKKAAEFMDEASKEKQLIREFESAYSKLQLASQDFDEVAPKKNEFMAAPAGMHSLISEGISRLNLNMDETQAMRLKLEKDLQERQAFVNKTYTDGKSLAENGKWLEALYEWEKLTPYLDPKTGVLAEMQNIKKSWKALEEAKRANEVFIATQYQDVKLPFTPEMEKMLIELDGSIQQGMEKANTSRNTMEKALAERQSWVQSTFEKGKTYYEVGKYKEAIEFWSSLAPQLKNEPKLQSLIASLPQRYEELVKAQESAKSKETLKSQPLDPPADFMSMLTGLIEKIQAKQIEAMSLGEKAKLEADQKVATMNELFAAGQISYQKGDVAAAIKAWSGIPPYTKDEPKIKAAIDQLAASHQSYLQTVRDMKEAQARLDGKFDVPADLRQLLADASFKLDKERQETLLAKERTDKIVLQKNEAITKIFNDGKVFYDQGKLADAFSAWRSMMPSLKDEPELTQQLNKADESYQMYLAAKSQNQLSLAQKEMKLQAPEELSEILETAITKLRDDVFDLKTRTSQTEKLMEDRRNWLQVTFEKGKLAFAQGRYTDAVSEWKTMLPFVENGPQFERAISMFEQNMAVSLEASKINVEAENKKNAKFPAPDELGALLVQLNERVKNEALEANAEKIRAEQQYSERQKWIQETYELGKNFFTQNKYDQALSEWQKLSPYLEAQSGAQKLIDAVKANYEAATEAKKNAVEATAQDYEGLKLPYAEQMMKLLTEADNKLREEAAAYSQKKDQMEKTMAERQEWSVTTFNKGKVYYDQGRYEEALSQWERLLPYLAEGNSLKTQIQSIREHYNTIIAGKNALGEGGSEPPVRLKNEEELAAVLEDANAKLKEQSDAVRLKKLELEKTFEQRKEWIEFTFKKGKTLYDQGQYAKAVEEWGVLGPYLGEHPKVRTLIEEAKKNYQDGQYTKQIIAALENKKASLASLPAPKAAVVQAVAAPEEASSEETSADEQEQQQQTTSYETTSSTEGTQLVSGEVSSIDENEKSMTLSVINESGNVETLTVRYDETTKLGGAATKSLASIPNGSSIDVRYNPETSQALYVYVY